MTTPHEFLRLVVDPVRLAVLGAAAVADIDVGAIAESQRVPPRRVSEAVARLRAAGLITAEGSLATEELRRLARDLPRAPAPDPEVAGKGEWSQEELDVLGRFFSGRRLTRVPAARAKRLVVLERLAQEFEPGVRYDEREVNFALQLWHADYAALRRYLVDEGLLTRADGVYWRTGGRYEPPEQQ